MKKPILSKLFNQTQTNLLYKAIESARLRAKQNLKSSGRSENEQKWKVRLNELEEIKEIICSEIKMDGNLNA